MVFGVHVDDSTSNRASGTPTLSTAAAPRETQLGQTLVFFLPQKEHQSAGLGSEHQEVPGSAEHSSGFPKRSSSAGV